MAYTTINKSAVHFNAKLYTGNDSANHAITGVGFKPDWIWIKSRSVATAHSLTDVVRGVGKNILSNSSAVQFTNTNYIKSFDSDGFTTNDDGDINGNNRTYASWNWKAGGSQGSSNTDGSLNTTYTSVNTTAGFSISTYTGNGYAGATVGHGLGAVPKMIIVKRLNSVDNWRVYHASLGATKYLDLNGNGAANTSSTRWNDTEPTSSVFTLGNNTSVNASASTYVAYCFAEKNGYSKFGSWISNNNVDGTFVYTGFAPSFVMLKQTDGTNKWVMYDNKRPGYNQTSNALFANSTDAEATDLGIDILSNGYKIRSTNNQNTGSYIYMAFGQTLVGTNNIPNNAR